MCLRVVGHTSNTVAVWPMAAAAKTSRFLVSCRRYAAFDDSKLRQIIETSNMGIANKLEQQKREIDMAKKPSTRWMKIERNYKSSQRIVIDRLRAGALGSSLSSVINVHSEPISETGDMTKMLRAKLADLRATLTSATKALNDLTGYTKIEKLKSSVEVLESELRKAKADLKVAKADYSDAIQRRSDLQKEVNELLTRKHNWTPEDLERFTELYRSDHQNQQDEREAEIKLEEQEVAVDTVQVKLTQQILTRYHEEQIWSDKIRQGLTWGTWMLMGLNVVLFAVATFLVEPWKRRRLVDAFQHEVQLKLDEFSLDIRHLSRELEVKRVAQAATPQDTVEVFTVSRDHNSSSSERSADALYSIGFSAIRSWSSFQTWSKNIFWALRDPSTNDYHMDKLDFGILLGLLVTLGGTLGALLTYLVVK